MMDASHHAPNIIVNTVTECDVTSGSTPKRFLWTAEWRGGRLLIYKEKKSPVPSAVVPCNWWSYFPFRPGANRNRFASLFETTQKPTRKVEEELTIQESRVSLSLSLRLLYSFFRSFHTRGAFFFFFFVRSASVPAAPSPGYCLYFIVLFLPPPPSCYQHNFFLSFSLLKSH